MTTILQDYTSFIEQAIQRLTFPEKPSNLYDPLRYFMQLGGKRMRPILTLLAAELFGETKEKALNAALAVEVFHNFSLIHDDIMDAAPLRRNHQTVHTKWNENSAILAGDVLLVHAYQLLAASNSEHLAPLLHLFNATASEVCEGQQMDMDFEMRTDVSVPEYIEMIRLKTSVLLGCALKMGAIIANASTQDRELIYSFGVNIGIAFQIQDDVLDLYADSDKFGKQVGGDVISNKKTLLNLKALELANEAQAKQLNALYAEQDPTLKVEKAQQLYNEIGVKEACEIEMEHYYNQAISQLSQLTLTPKAKQPLADLATFIIQREN